MSNVACSKCKIPKAPSEFHKNRAAPGGLRLECKSCRRLKAVKDYAAAPEASKQRSTEWARANPERTRARQGRHNERHRERRRAVCRDWQKRNRPQDAERAARKRAIVRQATPAWADMDAIRRIYEQAAEESQRTGQPIQVDHIYPLNSPLVCGLHVHNNLQLLPAAANAAKKNRLIQPDGGGLSL